MLKKLTLKTFPVFLEVPLEPVSVRIGLFDPHAAGKSIVYVLRGGKEKKYDKMKKEKEKKQGRKKERGRRGREKREISLMFTPVHN